MEAIVSFFVEVSDPYRLRQTHYNFILNWRQMSTRDRQLG